MKNLNNLINKLPYKEASILSTIDNRYNYFLSLAEEAKQELKEKIKEFKKLNDKKLLQHESICQLCNKKYDRTLDSKEIKESGEYICQDCWNNEENN